MWMRDFDLTPLMRSMVGFDRMLQLLESARDGAASTSYPPYNIEKTGENAWRIEIAVAGFLPDELTVTQEQNELVVLGAKKTEQTGQYLYRGIATRSFERRFELADYVEVKTAHYADGMLVIELVRELPEELQPRRIEISVGSPAAISRGAPPRLEQKAA